MAKKAVQIEVAEVGEQRFLLKTFDDGSEERSPIVKELKKKGLRPRVDWSRKLSKGRKRGSYGSESARPKDGGNAALVHHDR